MAHIDRRNKKRLQSHTIYGETLEGEPIVSIAENGTFLSPEALRGKVQSTTAKAEGGSDISFY